MSDLESEYFPESDKHKVNFQDYLSLTRMIINNISKENQILESLFGYQFCFDHDDTDRVYFEGYCDYTEKKIYQIITERFPPKLWKSFSIQECCIIKIPSCDVQDVIEWLRFPYEEKVEFVEDLTPFIVREVWDNMTELIGCWNHQNVYESSREMIDSGMIISTNDNRFMTHNLMTIHNKESGEMLIPFNNFVKFHQWLTQPFPVERRIEFELHYWLFVYCKNLGAIITKGKYKYFVKSNNHPKIEILLSKYKSKKKSTDETKVYIINENEAVHIYNQLWYQHYKE